MNKKAKKIKYLHIMPHHSITHNSSMIELINNRELGFNPEEHLFIVQHQSVYEACKKHKNVVLNKSIVSKDMKTFIWYSNQSKCVLLHCNSLSLRQLSKLNNKILGKITWCVWGHDLYSYNWSPLCYEIGLFNKVKKLILNILKLIYNVGRSFKIRKMNAVAVGFLGDAIQVRSKYGNSLRILSGPYGYSENKKKIIDSIFDKRVPSTSQQVYKIMIGHSSYRFLKHIEIMEKLMKYKEKNIIISLILSYGDMEYAKEVEKFAVANFGSKVEIIKEPMNIEDYLLYLKTVDICILDFKHQSALGNIYRLLYLGKKIYLNKDGIIKTSLMLQGIETYNVEDIDNMSFEEFSAPVKNANVNKQLIVGQIDEKIIARKWKNMLSELG